MITQNGVDNESMMDKVYSFSGLSTQKYFAVGTSTFQENSSRYEFV